MKKATEFVGVKMTPQERQKLMALAKEVNTTPSQVIKDLIRRAKVAPTIVIAEDV
jgi:hypothetical protein